jgi:hypothetical protein
MPNPKLDAAYRGTDYMADAPFGPILIRVGEPCRLLDTDSWAYLTACNPRSQKLEPDDNDRRMHRLEQELTARCFRYFRGQARARDASWPEEPSILVTDISEREAVELARKFDQAAIVCGRRGESARLVWIDDCVPPPQS